MKKSLYEYKNSISESVLTVIDWWSTDAPHGAGVRAARISGLHKSGFVYTKRARRSISLLTFFAMCAAVDRKPSDILKDLGL